MQREPTWYVSALLVLIAIIIFAITAFGVTVGDTSAVEMVAAGLAFLAASMLVP